MIPRGLRREQLVCEVDRVPENGWFSWYEVPLATAASATAPRLAAPAPAGLSPSVIAATRDRDERTILSRAIGLMGTAITHIQFEADPNSPALGGILLRIEELGFGTIAAAHLDGPATSKQLLSIADRLADAGAAIVKIVYPSTTYAGARHGLEALERWPEDGTPLSLTPASSRISRLAAALAGSALVFVPMKNEPDRMCAAWWRDLLSPPQIPPQRKE